MSRSAYIGSQKSISSLPWIVAASSPSRSTDPPSATNLIFPSRRNYINIPLIQYLSAGAECGWTMSTLVNSVVFLQRFCAVALRCLPALWLAAPPHSTVSTCLCERERMWGGGEDNPLPVQNPQLLEQGPAARLWGRPPLITGLTLHTRLKSFSY